MSQTKALLWKEWLEIRVFFHIALFVFLGLPLLGGLESRIQTGRFEIMASAWTYFLGGIFAIFVGVGTVVREMKGRLEDFWRSRPVGVAQWLVIKYFVGLAVVIVTLMPPLILELLVNQTEADLYARPELVLAWHPFMWAALYSVGFMMACLVRRGAHAAMLSVAVMLLLYFLPEVIPPLRQFSLAWAIEESANPRSDPSGNVLPIYHHVPWALGRVLFRPAQLQFVLAMLVLCAIALASSLVIIRRNVRVESGRRTIYWSLGGAVLILFSSACFQVATNLNLLQTVTLGKGEWVGVLRGDAEQGIIVTSQWTPKDPADPTGPATSLYRIRPFHVSSTGIELGESTVIGKDFWWQHTLWQPQRPNVLYGVRIAPEGYVDEHYPILVTGQLGMPEGKVTEQPFPKLLVNSNEGAFDSIVYAAGDRLYLLFGPYLVVFDISNPFQPKPISRSTIDVAYRRAYHYLDREINGEITIPLPQVPGLTARQRLEAVTANWVRFDGEILVRRPSEDQLVTYRLTLLTDAEATFQKAGQYESTPIERLFGTSRSSSALRNGLYFAALGSRLDRGSRLAVFDVRDPQRPHPIAHGAFPTTQVPYNLLPLADGRLIASEGNTLWLISAPPKRD
jgi:hypothetical protein